MRSVCVALLLCAALAAGYSHNATLPYAGGTPCIKLSYDQLYYSDGLNDNFNATEPTILPQHSVGNCSDQVMVKNATTYESWITFDLTLNATTNLSLVLTFKFAQNATYLANGTQVSGDKTANLVEILVNSTAGISKQAATFTLDPASRTWNAPYNSSFLCNYNFTYTTTTVNTTAKVPPVISIINLQAQAFIYEPEKDFGPAANSAACPSSNNSKSTKVIGLIVGGVLTGLALLGIVGFAISRCRTDRAEYESI